MSQIELNSDDIKVYLRHIVNNNRHIQKEGKTPIACEIIGESGLGKTSVTLQLAKELGMNHEKINLAQIEELGDLIGFPMRQFQMQKGTPTKKVIVEDGKRKVVEGNVPTQWVDEVATEQYAKNGWEFTGEKRMSYCPPEWIADKKGGGFLILDDWNRADIRFIQAVMELIDRQEYISWKLPKDWHILLSANPDDGKYLVQAMDVAQKTRFMSIIMKWDKDCWAKWAEEIGMDGRCINFLLFHEQEIMNKDAAVNPRSLTNFFTSISSLENFKDHKPLIQNLGEGSVGQEVATLFNTFIHNNMDKWITPKDVLHSPSTQNVIDELKAMFEVSDSYRADIASVMTTRLINYSIAYAEENPIGSEIIDRLIALVKDDDVFTDDLRYHVVKKIVNGNKQKFQKLLNDTTVQELATK
jgi:hypothetical protein